MVVDVQTFVTLLCHVRIHFAVSTTLENLVNFANMDRILMQGNSNDNIGTLEKNKSYHEKKKLGKVDTTTPDPKKNKSGFLPLKFFIAVFLAVPGLVGCSVCVTMLANRSEFRCTDLLAVLLSCSCITNAWRKYNDNQTVRRRAQNRRARNSDTQYYEELANEARLRRAVPTAPPELETPSSSVRTTSIAINTEPSPSAPGFTDILEARTTPSLLITLDPHSAPPDYSQVSGPSATALSIQPASHDDEALPSYEQAVKKIKPVKAETNLPPPPSYDVVFNDESNV